MTTPGGESGFEYTDDSVIARVSFDVPASAVNDISQITQVMSAMRTQLEAVSRAQGDWLEYLGQVPQIAERANQAFREQITLMERLSYIQNEIGGAGGVGGVPTAGYGGEMAGGGGQGGYPGGPGGGYSTAAPPGYGNGPFEGMVSGTGVTPNMNVAAGQIAKILGMEDDRAIGEMMTSRGMAINPALLGMAGGAAIAGYGNTSGKGTKEEASTATPPKDRESENPPDPNAGGVPQKDPDASGGSGNPLIDGILGGMGPDIAAILSRVGLGKVFSKDSILNKTFNNKYARVGAGIGVGAAGFNMVQNIGERVTRLQQIGSEEGGDFSTGIKEDLLARIQAIDPFINTDQARRSIQLPMSAGFQGESREELRELLQSNFKDLGVSFAETMRFQMANLQGVPLTDLDAVSKSGEMNSQFLNTLKELAGDGGNTMALSQRKEQALQLTEALTGMGVGQDAIQRGVIGLQQGYDDSLELRNTIPRRNAQIMGNANMMAVIGQKVGITGIVPEAMPAALADAGFDPQQIEQMVAEEVAGYVSGLTPEYNRIGTFMKFMNQQGIEMNYVEAKALLEKVTGKKSDRPVQKANKRVSELGQKNHQTNWNPFSFIGDVLSPTLMARSLEDFKNIPGDTLDAIRGYHPASPNAEATAESYSRSGRTPDNQFAPSGKKGAPLPQSMNQVPSTINTTGQVTGTLTVNVDQQGRVTAPPTIQLTGQQKAAFAGSGGAQVNSAPPGDPNYNHSYNPFPGQG